MAGAPTAVELLQAYKADIEGEYPISKEHVAFYRENGFIRLKQIFRPDTLERIGDEITAAVRAADAKPLEDDDAYAAAFTQVMNLWTTHTGVRDFVLSAKLGRIAAQLMEVEGVRCYHDQALYKEPHGGQTPWHADQFYWPLSSDRTITAWIPLQAVPDDMGPLEFAAKSHKDDIGRTLNISADNDRKIKEEIEGRAYDIVKGPFDVGEISFHSGWTFHRADGNSTDKPRKVMTVIYMDKDIRLIESQHDNHRADIQRFLPGLKAGDLAASTKNPIIWSAA